MRQLVCSSGLEQLRARTDGTQRSPKRGAVSTELYAASSRSHPRQLKALTALADPTRRCVRRRRSLRSRFFHRRLLLSAHPGHSGVALFPAIFLSIFLLSLPRSFPDWAEQPAATSSPVATGALGLLEQKCERRRECTPGTLQELPASDAVTSRGAAEVTRYAPPMRVRRCALGAPAAVRVLGILCAILRIPSPREQLPPVPERVRGAPGRARFACVRGIFLTSYNAAAAARLPLA